MKTPKDSPNGIIQMKRHALATHAHTEAFVFWDRHRVSSKLVMLVQQGWLYGKIFASLWTLPVLQSSCELS